VEDTQLSKISIKEIKKIITEARREQVWHDKFVKNFVDVRKGEVLTEQQLDEMAGHLYQLLKQETS